MSSLIPCHGCARHIRAGETRCPFCAIDRGALAGVSVRVDALHVDRSNVRAALFFGALAATGVSSVACEKKPLDSGTSGTTTAIAQPYGVPVIRDEDAGSSATTTDAARPPNVVQPYGVPVMRDAGKKP